MPDTFKIKYIKEPTSLQCGQAVLAMLTEKTVDEIIALLDNDRETTKNQMFSVLDRFHIRYSKERKQAETKLQLPEVCILSLETPRCWHWSLYAYGVFYDPEHGISHDFPICNRKYFFEVMIE